MPSWSHGYNVEVPYTFGYYKETSPLWIKWGVFLGGRKPPLNNSLRVLELGCGQGYNLCMHAACFPQIEFVGIDFNPSHIAHAKELAELSGLRNVSFYEGDFVELADNFPEEWGEFDIVILHGIWSWISKPVRMKVVEILKRVVLPGGVVYNSYNAMPGWMTGMILRELLRGYYKISNLPALQALEKGFELAKKLMEVNAQVFNVYPNLKNRVEMAMKHNRNYVVHEYINEAHEIFWVQEVVEEMLEGKLYYAGSATLIENYLPRLLPDPMEKLVNQFTHPIFRLFLIDLMINQAFRRDLYQKGQILPLGIEHVREIKKVRFIKVEDPEWKEGEEYRFQTPAGQIQGRKEVYEPILKFFEDGEPRSVEEVLNIPELKSQGVMLPGVIQALTLLVDKGVLAFYNEGHDISHSFKFNKTVAKLCSEGRMYSFLASPKAGTGVMLTNLEMMIFNALLEGIREVPELVKRTEENLRVLGRQVIKDGKVVENPEEERKVIEDAVKEFVVKKIPKLKLHGILL